MGRKGEPRAVDTLLTRLRQEGLQPGLAAGRDERGEDAILLLQGERLTLQVVSVPSVAELWRDANRSSATTSAPAANAAMELPRFSGQVTAWPRCRVIPWSGSRGRRPPRGAGQRPASPQHTLAPWTSAPVLLS